jgi:uncharacterized protein (DUF2235 family)
MGEQQKRPKNSKARNIVLCSDGTGNAGGRGPASNVWRIHEAVKRDPPFGGDDPPQRQKVMYDDGVGTQSLKPAMILGGALGVGMKKDLRELYGRLIREFTIHEDDGCEYGDNLFLFGFSRGAFTIRVLANVLYQCGITDIYRSRGDSRARRTPEEIDALAHEALDAYARRIWDAEAPAKFRRKHGLRWSPAQVENLSADRQGRFPIKFVGVWDTVDAVGLPFDNVTQMLTRWGVYGFRMNMRRPENLRRRQRHDGTSLDDDLHDWSENGYHAISVDDERHTFHPVLWLEFDEQNRHKGSRNTATGRPRRIEQAWFAGVHTNVGGGNPKDHLAYVSLDWMMCHARRAGLRFDQSRWTDYRQELDELGKLYDSRSGAGAFYRFKPRNIAELCDNVGLDASLPERKPRIHASVIRRIQRSTREYAPAGLPPLGCYAQVDVAPIPASQMEGGTEAGECDTETFEQDTDGRVLPSSTTHTCAFVKEHPHNVVDNKNIRVETQELTAGFLSLRRGLYYALYLWVFALLGVGTYLGLSGDSWAIRPEAKGDEVGWFWPAVLTLSLGLLGSALSWWWHPARRDDIDVTSRYRAAQVFTSVGAAGWVA